MSLFPRWRGMIRLPALPERREKIGNNYVVQQPFRGARCEARISEAQVPGHDLIETDLLAPYRQILLRRKGAHRVVSPMPVLAAPGVENLEQLSEETTLTWDSLGELEAYAADPESVLESWRNRFEFREADEDNDIPGLRTPQIGALHAIAAHFSVGDQFEPATVVLPTGTGKTETMLATQVYRRLERTLVLVPSDTLRNQIFGKFVSLGVLPEAEVIPQELAGPRVARIGMGVRSVEEAQELIAKSNVIVTLPNTLQASSPEALQFLIEHCSDLIVDEAHHVTARTWGAIRERFRQKRIIQFTATPFRRDEKRVDGKIIFNYKLGDAQKADYYRPINLMTVEDYGDEASRDRSVALEAVAALRRDRAAGFDHVLMARTDDKTRADKVWELYGELAPDFNPVVVYSGTGRGQANRDALRQLLDRENSGTRIVVCVDMLGEGYDLPNLKIAALHDTHRSLAVTLQFIGRFTRKGTVGVIGEATVVTNIADPEAEQKLAGLYAEGADWDLLIKRLSEERIEEELQLQEVVMGLKERGDLHAQLSLWNLRPSLSTQIYRTACDEWTPLAYRDFLPTEAESWYALDEQRHILVVVIHRAGDVDWGDYQNLLNSFYDLIVIHWDPAAGAMFVNSSDYDGLRVERIAKAITGGTATLLHGPAIFNILNNVELPLVKSLGSSSIGAISFTSYFGPNVTDGLASIEKMESSLNNIACLGYEDGDRVLWGGAQRKGKVWQQKRGTIAQWLEWCGRTWRKVSSEDTSETNITRDFLRPEKLLGHYAAHPIAAQWGEQAQRRFSDKQFLVFDELEVPLFLVDVDISDVEADGAIIFSFQTEDTASSYRLRISSELPGGYAHEWVSGPKLAFKTSTNPAVPVEEYFMKDPLVVRYADGTQSYNCYHIPTRLDAGAYPLDMLEYWDWSDIPLNRESMGKEGKQDTIQYRAFTHIADEYPVILNDDGCGEAADLVALRDTDDGGIKLCLVHCKGAVGGQISGDIRNFYALCGQAQKSIAVKHAGIPTLYHDLKRRHDTWMRQHASRFLKGDMKQLAYFKEKARRAKVDFEVIVAQPGVSPATISPEILRLLATTELYLTKTTQARFRVAVSS